MEKSDKKEDAQAEVTQKPVVSLLLMLISLSSLVLGHFDGRLQTDWSLSDEQEARAEILLASDPDFTDWVEIDSWTANIKTNKGSLIETYEFLARMNRKWKAIEPEQLQAQINRILKDDWTSEDVMYAKNRKHLDLLREIFWKKIAYTIIFRKAEPLACNMAQIESLTKSSVPLPAKEVSDYYANLDWTRFSFYELSAMSPDGGRRPDRGFGFNAAGDTEGRVFKIWIKLARTYINFHHLNRLDDKGKEDLFASTLNQLCRETLPDLENLLVGLFPEDARSFLDAFRELSQACADDLKARMVAADGQESFLYLGDNWKTHLESETLEAELLFGRGNLTMEIKKKTTSDILREYELLANNPEH